MSEACVHCPCADICLRRADFCTWAANPAPGELGGVQLRHICARSVLGVHPTPAEYPSAVQQAGNLSRALWDWAVSGFSMASEAEVERRLSICRDCIQWDGGRCRICGCALGVKVRLRTEHCPLAEPKW